MAELPELTILQKQMHQALAGRRIVEVEILQPKCLNVPQAEAEGVLTGRAITAVRRRGKWLALELDPPHYLLLNLGMGADLWHYKPGDKLLDKYMFRLGLDDGTGFTCRFWWFGYIHLLSADSLAMHKETAKLGPSPMEVSVAELIAIARKYPRSNLKSLILDQEKLAGIGNAYAHDILWKAHLHPARKLGTLTDEDLERYHEAIQFIMKRALEMGGIEQDFYRQGGNINNWEAFSLIGYKEHKPCPACGTAIEKIETGATATYICPTCQA